VCRFCVEHGEGERWYLQARNYAYDLESDLKRRGYMVSFLRDFDRNRAKVIAGLDVARTLPKPIADFGRRKFQAAMREHHFGQPVPIEDVEGILDLATSITRIPCVCRRFAGTRDERHCFLVTTQPVGDILVEGFRDYVDGPRLEDFHVVPKAEALAAMCGFEERGLMHSVWTFETPFIAAICNCDVASGCMAMKISVSYDTPIMWRGESFAEVDREACAGCGECVALCPFGVMRQAADRRVEVSPSACWGCGVCRAGCATRAIRLRDRRELPLAAQAW